MVALADGGATWQSWGGAWNPGDAVHFELPGASDRARQRGEELAQQQAPFLVSLASSIPFGLSMSLIFDFFGIPTAARKNVTPEQETYLRDLAQPYGLKYLPLPLLLPPFGSSTGRQRYRFALRSLLTLPC